MTYKQPLVEDCFDVEFKRFKGALLKAVCLATVVICLFLFIVISTSGGQDWMPPMPEPKVDVFSRAMSGDQWGMVEKSNVTMIDELKDMRMGSVHYGVNTTLRVTGDPAGSWRSFVWQDLENTGKGKSTQVAFTMQEM